MFQQEIAAIRLALSALFLTFIIIASLLANVISSQDGSSSLQQHHDDDSHQHNGTVDALAETARKSFSNAWAYYAPYYPAAPFDNSTREGCVVSQVNIVSHHFYHTAPRLMPNSSSSFNATAHDTPPPDWQYPSPPHLRNFSPSPATGMQNWTS